jgi:hypothetical protein
LQARIAALCSGPVAKILFSAVPCFEHRDRLHLNHRSCLSNFVSGVKRRLRSSSQNRVHPFVPHLRGKQFSMTD